MRLRADICLVALFGVSLLCATGGDGKNPVVVSDFCRGIEAEAKKAKTISSSEFKASGRTTKEVLLGVRRKYNQNCAGASQGGDR